MSRHCTDRAAVPENCEIDETTKLIGSRSHFPPGLMDEPTGVHLMRSDFRSYGYDEREVQALLALNEPAVDSRAQVIHGRLGREKREAERDLEVSARKTQKRSCAGTKNHAERERGSNGSGGGGKHKQQVYLDASKKWVLFDPFQGWPPTMEARPPAIYERYSWYQPGKRKVVAYNTESCAVALRSPPEVLQGCAVLYQKAGPKLVKETKVPKGSD